MTQTAFESLEVVNIQMVRERTLLYNGNRITAPEQCTEAFRTLIGLPDREFFVAMHLDGKNRINSVSVISQGSLNQSIVHPREVFKCALLSNAAAIIVVHNHPSGDVTPSQEDIAITKRLKEAGDIMGIRILDHIIVNTDNGDFCSFVERGLI